MTAIERTAYPRFKRVLTAKDLAEIYTPTPRERFLAHRSIKGAVRRSALDMKKEQGQVVDEHAYTRFIYQDASGQAIMEKWIVHQAGHAWSGAPALTMMTRASYLHCVVVKLKE